MPIAVEALIAGSSPAVVRRAVAARTRRERPTVRRPRVLPGPGRVVPAVPPLPPPPRVHPARLPTDARRVARAAGPRGPPPQLGERVRPVPCGRVRRSAAAPLPALRAGGPGLP